MQNLGDKISSTIIAQSAGVNCIEWSGSDVFLPESNENVVAIDENIYKLACIQSQDSLQSAASRIGYPLMIKASEGGGGKGIRLVKNADTLQNDYEMVMNEVPGSPIFAMKLCPESKHLEIQLVGDEHGNYTTIFGRDCSVQRRHQKIFEEGPILAASEKKVREMEEAAIRLARKVGYYNAGTVEYLYKPLTDSYYFLELNPRLQVEHPVSEMISGVNIPALQLQISMGIPLYNIPDIRAFYLADRNVVGRIDLALGNRRKPTCHVIAARITAENPATGFRPNLGKLNSLEFLSTPSTWAYFSIGSDSSIHQFSDSQFGHVFAKGEDRESARRALKSAISDLRVQGTFVSTSEALLSLLSSQEYQTMEFDTSWLDRLIYEGKLLNMQLVPDLDVAICVTAFMCTENLRKILAHFQDSLDRGIAPQLPSIDTRLNASFYFNDLHVVSLAEYSPTTKQIIIEINGETILANLIQEKPNGSITLCYGDRRHLIQRYETGSSIDRYVIDNQTIIIRTTDDDSSVESPSPGKLLRYKVNSGEYVQGGQAIAEVEIMKLCMDVNAPKSGKILLIQSPGNVLKAGDVIARIESDDNNATKIMKKFEEKPDYVVKPSGNLFADVIPKIEWLQNCLLVTNPSADTVFSCISDLKQLCQQKEFAKDYLKYNIARLEKLERLKLGKVIEKMDLVDLSELMKVSPTMAKLSDQIQRIKSTSGFIFVIDCIQSFSNYCKYLDSHGDLEKICVDLRGSDKMDAFQKVRFYLTIEQRVLALNSTLNTCFKVFGNIQDFPEFYDVIKCMSDLTSPAFSKVARRCRELLFQWQLPSIQDLYQKMEAKFEAALSKGGCTNENDRCTFVDDMVRGFSTHLDVLPRFFHHSKPQIAHLALEIYVRRMSESYTLCSLNSISQCPGSLHWTFGSGMNEPTAAEREFAMSPGLNANGETVDISGEYAELRSGIITSLSTDFDIENRLAECMAIFRKQGTSRNVLYFVVQLEGDVQSKAKEEECVELLSKVLQKEQSSLQSAQVSRLTLVLVRSAFPALGFYTFRSSLDYAEDFTIRHLDPSMAYLLEFNRMSNYHVGYSHADPTGQIHIYHGKANNDPTNAHDRLFVRLIIRPNQAMRHFNSIDELLQEMFRILEDCFDAVEAVLSTITVSKTLSNHLFLNVLPVFVNTASQVESVIRVVMDRYEQRIRKLMFRQAELKMNLATARGAPPTRHRFLLSNETGHRLDISAYYEERHPITGKYMMKPLTKPKIQNMDGIPSTTPYPSTLEATQLKRYRVQSTMGTNYVYDFATLFEQAILEVLPKARIVFEEGQIDATGKLEFAQRPIGTNKCGMVSWLCTVSTTNHRSTFVIIGNDIDFEIGSFGVEEDKLFYEASKYARINQLPRIFLSANSGARIGLADEVWNAFKVAWIDENNPQKGFKYLYFEESQLESMSRSVRFERVPLSPTQHHYRITDIIGLKDGIGVENLQGSALIAGETALANENSFTMTLVTGRSVGIGAYLVRLGQRAIQRQDQPIILTGFAALNSILGREVYQNNLQLGGPQTMSTNGVSHLVVRDDWEGVREVVKWLLYLPTFTPLRAIPLEDSSLDRDVQVDWETSPTSDPRVLLTGDGQGKLGMLDANSFHEYLCDWAPGVIVGRGRLGGQSVGVIVTECRTTTRRIPADPANPDSRQAVYPQAGQVWFPDSAFKTATALRDFRGEQLPVLIVANWRGFSGGQRDLFQEILKFGSMIVEQLCTFPLPVIVVIDSKINAKGMIEMYADPTSRGGIMEPEGLVGVKIRQRHYDSLCKRLSTNNLDKNTLHQIAVHFADLHDTPGRMLAKQVIKAVVPLRESRRILGNRLQRRLIEVRQNVRPEDMQSLGHTIDDNDAQWLKLFHHHSATILDNAARRSKETRRQELLAELASLE